MPQKMRYDVSVVLTLPIDDPDADPWPVEQHAENRYLEHAIITALSHMGDIDAEVLHVQAVTDGGGLPPIQPCIACHGRGTLAPIEEAGGWMQSCGACKGTGAQP